MVDRKQVRYITCIVFAFVANALTLSAATAQNDSEAKPRVADQGSAPASSEPKKSNRRPAAAAKNRTEPYDDAPVAKMKDLCVTLRTIAGDIEIEMLAETAPDTVRNFLNLAATKAYDTTTFSRVVKGFVVQGGDLYTRENLTPALRERAARRIHDEPNPVKHVRGIVSMARAEEPDSATTNFFLLVGDAGHLDATFAAFGRVRSGMEVVDAINSAPAVGERPEKPVRISQATVASCQPLAN